MAVRTQMKNRKGSDGFAMQARVVTFNKLVGLSVNEAYATPAITKGEGKKTQQKRDLDAISLPKVTDLKGFSG